ncbi:MAG: DUF3800 domain-containing protein [Gammaproteobacteria bacterium SHHR-1]
MRKRGPNLPYSEFVVYVDESGDHSLVSIDPRYPVFVLSFCVFRKSVYNQQVAPAIRALKFATFGHDMVVLHEAELRRGRGAFEQMPLTRRNAFIAGLSEVIAGANFQLIAVAIDKYRLNQTYGPEPHAYHLALAQGLNSLFHLLVAEGQQGSLTHVVCEARGAKEDQELELEFRRLCDHAAYAQQGISLEVVIADKKTNAEGLQLADLTARPIGLSVLRPDQENRAARLLETKFYRDKAGNKRGAGFNVLPE